MDPKGKMGHSSAQIKCKGEKRRTENGTESEKQELETVVDEATIQEESVEDQGPKAQTGSIQSKSCTTRCSNTSKNKPYSIREMC